MFLGWEKEVSAQNELLATLTSLCDHSPSILCGVLDPSDSKQK